MGFRARLPGFESQPRHLLAVGSGVPTALGTEDPYITQGISMEDTPHKEGVSLW